MLGIAVKEAIIQLKKQTEPVRQNQKQPNQEFDTFLKRKNLLASLATAEDLEEQGRQGKGMIA